MLNILLVEDDEFFRAAVVSVLEDEKWKVTEAPDGKVAREIIKASKPFDIVISDIQMPHLTGVELLQWIKENKPMPVVLITGFALIIETQKADQLGADGFLAKPFDTAELVETVRRICPGNKAESVAHEPVQQYCKVPIMEFISSPKLLFDVYVKLGESRFLKIGRREDLIPRERIENYVEKGLKHLYVRNEDFPALVQFSLGLAKVLVQSDKVSKEKKASFMRYTNEIVLEKAFVKGIDQNSFNDAAAFLNLSLDLLTDEKTAFSIIQNMDAHFDQLYVHSLSVSVYSVLIAKQMGWTSISNLHKIGLAGLFHDIGKKEIDRSLLEKPRPLLTFAERQLIESHPERGRQILLAIPQIPSEVVAVAYEHHEDNLGQGYPRKIGKHELHPYTQIVRVANLFARFSSASTNHKVVTAKGALMEMRVHYGEGLGPQPLLALEQLVGG